MVWESYLHDLSLANEAQTHSDSSHSILFSFTSSFPLLHDKKSLLWIKMSSWGLGTAQWQVPTVQVWCPKFSPRIAPQARRDPRGIAIRDPKTTTKMCGLQCTANKCVWAPQVKQEKLGHHNITTIEKGRGNIKNETVSKAINLLHNLKKNMFIFNFSFSLPFVTFGRVFQAVFRGPMTTHDIRD